jgi:hypothetical protein
MGEKSPENEIVEGGFYKDAFSEDAVKAVTKHTLRLLPGN